ncbi:MAG TPA: immune inhibitor A domain-containing protein [Candidatus Limnocylindria bacterium]|nr:immune inhibitor A domain-containing protein [Candidatus Limnocylindria bacterium]
MSRSRARLVLVLLAMLTIVMPGTALAGDTGGYGAPSDKAVRNGHAKKQPPIVKKWEQQRLAAADLVARGRATPNADGIVTLPDGTPVRYALEDTEHLTVVLMDFADVEHNSIPKPDRSVDNSTYWTRNFSPRHYRDMLFVRGGGDYGFPSMRDFYIQQSSGRFTWRGQVSSWVQSDQPAAEYGANSRQAGAGGDDLNGPVYRVVREALQSLAQSGNYGGLDLSKVDQIDRYDCDGDGNFEEPDGYFDHFGLVHAGEGEEAGASPDTIWSHRWYANFNDDAGPGTCKLGGYRLPGTRLWVGDYTTEPENGAVGVFAHEFGHDLGLPDLYDTSGGSENGTGFWTLMSSGSWASYARNSIDTAPVHMGAWEKLVLGWLDLETATLGDDKVVDLGPAEHATEGRAQALRVNLPDYDRTTTVFAPQRDDPNYYYSGKGNDIDHSMVRTLPSALGSATPITFNAIWNIETDWDYAYLRARVNGVWQEVQTSASRTTDPNGQNFGFGITGTARRWTTVSATLPAGTTAYGFRYWTDGSVVGNGFAVDSIQLGSGAVDTASAADASAWTFDGFQRLVNGQYTQSYFHYYLVESRSYIQNDRSLCGAYNFIFGNFLEKQCYADGLLIWYRNSFYEDNDTALHPGGGQILPVDSHPATMIRPDGKTAWRTRWQTWDATFGVDTNSVTLSQLTNKGILSQTYTSGPVSSFVDSSPTAYWNAEIPFNSVQTAGSGLRIDITGVSADRGSYRVHVHD